MVWGYGGGGGAKLIVVQTIDDKTSWLGSSTKRVNKAASLSNHDRAHCSVLHVELLLQFVEHYC